MPGVGPWLGRGGRDQVIGVDHGQAGHLLGRRPHHAVVHEAQPIKAIRNKQPLRLSNVYRSPEQVRDLAAHRPRRVVLEPSRKPLQ